MSLIKVIRHGQITLPAQIRNALHLEEGDYLEAKLDGDQIVLKPKVVMDKTEAAERLNRLLDKVHARTEEIPEEEIEQDVQQAIRAVRQERADA